MPRWSPVCARGHKREPGRRRCRSCINLRARSYRAAGANWGRPERRKEAYWRSRDKELGSCRARYHANKAKYCTLRRINRLKKCIDLTLDEADHLKELIRQVAAVKTVSSVNLPPHPKVRFVR